MKTTLIAILAFVAGAGAMAEYTKRQKPAPVVQVAKPPPPKEKHVPSTQERLTEIESVLSMPITGTPEDADLRWTLRNERDILTGRAKAIPHHSVPPRKPSATPASEEPQTALTAAQ